MKIISKKYGVFNPIIGRYEYFESKNDFPERIVQMALDFYYLQTKGFLFHTVNYDEFGNEIQEEASQSPVDIPEDILRKTLLQVEQTL